MSYYIESEIKKWYLIYSSQKQFSRECLFSEASRSKPHYDIFLSHSSRDEILIEAIFVRLQTKGFSVFLDKRDANRTSIDEMASHLKNAMDKSTYLLYLHTHNSINSKWVPWELGYFDCKKGSNRILVLPTLNDSRKFASYKGQEYLEHYDEIDLNDLVNLRDISNNFDNFNLIY